MISMPDVIYNESITLHCPASGLPVPEVRWLRNNVPVIANTTDVFILDNGWRLRIQNAQEYHTGRYTCTAHNIAGSAEKHFDLTVLCTFRTLSLHIHNIVLLICTSLNV